MENMINCAHAGMETRTSLTIEVLQSETADSVFIFI
jgi:hypothetical protein